MDRFVVKRTAPQEFDAAESSRPLRLRQDNQGSSSRLPTPNVSRPPTPSVPPDIDLDELPYDPAKKEGEVPRKVKYVAFYRILEPSTLYSICI